MAGVAMIGSCRSLLRASVVIRDFSALRDTPQGRHLPPRADAHPTHGHADASFRRRPLVPLPLDQLEEAAVAGGQPDGEAGAEEWIGAALRELGSPRLAAAAADLGD